jgi:hypothetical protein
MHDHSNMIIHIPPHIPQEHTGNNTHAPKRYTRQIHVLIRLRIRDSPRFDDHHPRGLIPIDAEDGFYSVDEGCAAEHDGLLDVRLVRDVELEGHGSADVVHCVRDEFGDEDVIIRRLKRGYQQVVTLTDRSGEEGGVRGF